MWEQMNHQMMLKELRLVGKRNNEVCPRENWQEEKKQSVGEIKREVWTDCEYPAKPFACEFKRHSKTCMYMGLRWFSSFYIESGYTGHRAGSESSQFRIPRGVTSQRTKEIVNSSDFTCWNKSRYSRISLHTWRHFPQKHHDSFYMSALAVAPVIISTSSPVMAAWRWRLYKIWNLQES